MNNTLPVFLLVCILMITTCTPQVPATQVPVNTHELTTPAEMQTPVAVPPTDGDIPLSPNSYSNSAFGLSFQYPSDWFGPEEYISDQSLRVEVGSDKVYPYGNPPEQPSSVKNSYNVVIQYTKNNQTPYWKDTYQTLQNLKDGESLSGIRSLIIRVRQLDMGNFSGFEYIFTLSETAQAECLYGREIILFDEQTNDLLTIMGGPNNVEVPDGTDWRDIYRSIDETNLPFFHKIADSITIK